MKENNYNIEKCKEIICNIITNKLKLEDLSDEELDVLFSNMYYIRILRNNCQEHALLSSGVAHLYAIVLKLEALALEKNFLKYRQNIKKKEQD